MRARVLGLSVVLLSAAANAATLDVGPGKTYAAPCAAFAAAADGDTISIDPAGDYKGDFCAIAKNGLTIKSAGAARAKMDATGVTLSNGKAIWVVQGTDTTVEGIEFVGASVPDANGAGIRQEGDNLTVRNCYFHDNEDGILESNKPNSTILVELSEFEHNGAGDGYSHNLYIGHAKELTFRYNYSHRGNVGHLLKSRAATNFILYNRLTDESAGEASYEINLPNGGLSYVIGNLIEQGPNTMNGAIVDYGSEGPGAMSDLFFVNNTVANDRPSGGTFLQVAAAVTTPAVVRNNILFGPGTVCTQASAVLDHNLVMTDPQFVDMAQYDYHLKAGSPAVDAGADPGMGDGQQLTPDHQYVHPASSEGRMTVGTIDIGAYELGGGTSTGAGGGSMSATAGAGAGSATSGSAGGATGPSGAGATSGPSGAGGGATNGESDASSGCGCRVRGGDERSAVVLALAAVAFAAARRRRRA